MRDLYSPSIEDFPTEISSPCENKKTYRWYHCGEEPFSVHKSVSEASMYRANSRFSLKSESVGSKTLDYLLRCFWVCSTGCHQTT